MNEAQKRMKAQWRDQQRKAALAALPLPVPELKAMFDMLDVEFPRRGCDHTRRLTAGVGIDNLDAFHFLNSV